MATLVIIRTKTEAAQEGGAAIKERAGLLSHAGEVQAWAVGARSAPREAASY